MIRTIRLYGELGKKFGRVHKLHVASVGEAIRALSANFKEFRQHLIDSDKRLAGYEVWSGKENLSDDEKEYSVHSNQDIKIIPRVRGSGAAARIVVGVVLVAVALYTGQAQLGATAFQMMISMGASLVMGGIAELLSKSAGVSDALSSSSVNSDSYIFSGPQNTMRQGNPVAVGYGEMIIGSQVISATLTVADIPIS